MNQDERRLFLIRHLMNEDIRLRRLQIPDDVQGQRDMLRSLMNIRLPRHAADDFLTVQDEYLR